MRNLDVCREQRASVKLISELDGEVLVAATYDANHGRFYFASSTCTAYSLSFSGQDQWAVSLLEEKSDGSPAVLKDPDRIVGLMFLLEKDALVLGMEAGDIFELDPESRRVEVVGAIEGGIVNMALSPDGEVLVVASGLGQLLLMTQEWDVLYEISHQSPGSNRSGLIPPGGVQISWRGDGKYFCTLETTSDLPAGGVATTTATGTTTSSIKVWEREFGVLHSSGETLPHMEHSALSWSPSGSRIATACRRPDTGEPPMVVLFERNGLKRSSFEILAPAEGKVHTLSWNADSELLAIIARCGDKDFVQIWNISNFHWYLKKERRYAAELEVKVFWDPEKSSRLLCWTAAGRLSRLTFCWKTSVKDCSTAFVIDGKDVLVTPLSLSIIPPPMFLFKLEFSSPVQALAVLFDSSAAAGDRCLVAGGLSDGSLGMVVLPGLEAWDDLEGTAIPAVEVTSDSFGLNFGNVRHLMWLGPSFLIGSWFFRGGVATDWKESRWVTNSIASRESASTLAASGCHLDGEEGLIQLRVVGETLSDGSPSEGRSSSSSSLVSHNWMVKVVRRTFVDRRALAIAPSPLKSSSSFSSTDRAMAFIQLTDGSVICYSSDGDDGGDDGNGGCDKNPKAGTVVPHSVKFGSPSPWMQAIGRVKVQEAESHVVLVGLDEQGGLQVNDQLVSSDCTSFDVHQSLAGARGNTVAHLVYTTRADTLHVINLDEILAGGVSGGGEKLSISSFAPAGKLERPTTLVGKSAARAGKGINKGLDILRIRPMWERDARLVTTVGGKDVSVILQTIRGNLETICPRGLVLGAIATFLTRETFEDAVFLARRHHINLNVIVDYKGWEEFSRAAHTFVKQVRNLSHVTEVVQALSKENVMETTYKNLIPVYDKNADAPPTVNGVQQQPELIGDKSSGIEKSSSGVEEELKRGGGKVRVVLSAIRSALQTELDDSPARELCILTTLARSDPPELEAALERIRALREAEVNQQGQGISEGDDAAAASNYDKGNFLSAEAAVKHLIWLTDAEVVFGIALGLYDLHLAAMVAVHSQRDPKEFLPLLEQLGNMPSPQMKYTIDCRLGRFESALRNCVDMGSCHFPSCIQLIKANPTLFPSGLQIYKEGEQRAVLLDAWGDHLVKEGKFENAGVTFCACSRFDKALDAYRQGGLWESVMTMAGRLGKSSTEICQLAGELRDELEAMGRPREAARVALDYCGDVESAISLLLDAHDWLEVTRLCYLHGKRDLIGLELEPAVVENASSQLKELEEGVEKVGKYLARFLGIHQRRTLLAAKLRSEGEGQGRTDDDAASDISLSSGSTHSSISGLSRLSAYTHGTARTHSSSSSSRKNARGHRPQGGRIRAGSPGEELALKEYLKSMAPSSSALEEHRLLLQALLQLGHESTARRLQQAMSRFLTVQEAAVRETEEKLAIEELILVAEEKLREQNRKSNLITTSVKSLNGLHLRTQPDLRPVPPSVIVDWQWEILK